jgi:Right handed beta helix region
MRISNSKFPIVFLCALAASPSAQELSAVTLAPSGGDDTAALQADLKSAQSVTITGTLRISSSVVPVNGSSISGGTLLWTGAQQLGTSYAIKFGGASFAATGTTFNGAGLNIDGANGVSITNCTVENIPAGANTQPAAIYFGSLNNATINANHFVNVALVGAICGYNPSNSTFDGNTWRPPASGTPGEEPIHIIFTNGAGNDDFSYNDFSGFARIGIEIQGDPKNIRITHNYIHDEAAENSHILLSIATGGSGNTGASGVVIDSNVLTYPAGMSLAAGQVNYCHIEAMGLDTLVTNNYCGGGGWCGLYANNAASGATSTAMAYRNNQFHSVAAGYPATGEGSSAPFIGLPPTFANNTQDNLWTGTVPAAILAAAGPAAMPGSPATAPASQPAVAVALVNNGDGSLSATWTPAGSSGAVAPALTLTATGNPSLTVSLGTLASGAVSAKIGNIPNNWIVQLTVSYGSLGSSSGSGTVQVTGGPAPAVPAGGWSPAIVPAATGPATTPAKTVTHTITVYSDGSVSSN